MISNKINSCINRISRVIREATVPLTVTEIQNTEKALNIVLANDFKKLCFIHRYDYIANFAFYNFRINAKFSVISETKGWRESVNLPHNYLVLSDDGTSVILMKVEGEEECSVIWCALEDVLNICDGSPMEYNPTIFSSFTDFYEFLLHEEEKDELKIN